MILETETGNQMSSLICDLLPWISVLITWLILSHLLEFGLASILFTSMALLLSSVLFALSRRKPVFMAEPLEEEIFRSDQETLPNKEDGALLSQPRIESMPQMREAQGQAKMFQPEGCAVRSSLDSSSESECINNFSTSEDSEVEWPFKEDMDHSPDCSDGSITDEESLIEISIPSGHYVGQKEEEPKFSLKQKFTDFTPGSIFQQNCLADLLAEINEMNEEDDNLIEIDISMGSIKCSRFEIEA